MELEYTDRDKEIMEKHAVEISKVLLVIPPRRLRNLADYMEKCIPNSDGTDVQDDLRKMADMSEEVLIKINKDYEAKRV